MAAIIAFIVALGIITNASEATPELVQQYEQEYQESIIIEDLDEM